MVAVARPVHERVDVGAPFYVGGRRPATAGAGAPAFHKFDRADFVDVFLAEARAAAGGATPASLLGPLVEDPAVPDVDTDGLDFLGRRFRKLYQPAHFRFYLAACELRCAVPGFPAPARAKIKKVELVIRRVAVTPDSDGNAVIGTEESAWVTIPSPSDFPRVPRAGTAPIDLAPRLTGNTRTWWPVPAGEDAAEGEERFKMNRAVGDGLAEHALYFGFLPLASGEMYGPRAQPADATAAPTSAIGKRLRGPEAGSALRPLVPEEISPARPLVAAPSNYKLAPASIKNWLRAWRIVLGVLRGGQSPNGPKPKFESPRVDGDPKQGFAGGFAYRVRCVATLEPRPGCTVEVWGAPSPPALIAPHFDPFGGRPTQIDVPSPGQIQAMLRGLSPSQIAARGGINTGLKNNGCQPQVDTSSGVNVTIPPTCTKEICFLGIPLITICAYIMFSIALVILLAIFPLSIFFNLKFCLPIPEGE